MEKKRFSRLLKIMNYCPLSLVGWYKVQLSIPTRGRRTQHKPTDTLLWTNFSITLYSLLKVISQTKKQ